MFSYFLLRGKVLCFACIGETCVTITAGDLVEKLYLRFYLTQIVHSNGKMLFLLLNNCLSKFLWRAAHIKFFLLQGKVLVFQQSRWQVCDLSKVFCWRDLRDDYCRWSCWKNCISGYAWHKSFIQTVKCSFFNQRNVYQSFCGALLTLSYFFLQGKVLCFGSRIGESVTCEMFIV